MAERISSENLELFRNALREHGAWPLLVIAVHPVLLVKLLSSAWRKVEFYLSILSFVLGMIVLTPLGLALAPFFLAYSHLGFAKSWATKYPYTFRE